MSSTQSPKAELGLLEEQDPFFSEGHSKPPSTWRSAMQVFSQTLPWIISTTVLGIWVVYLLFRDVYTHPLGTFEGGWKTDMQTARSKIELEVLRFRGSPIIKDNGEMFIPNPSPIQYTGDPSEALDKAWRDLSHVTYILLTDEEAHSAWGSDYEQFWNEDEGGYFAGIDMFHTLHCIDRIRRLLFPEHYHFQGYGNAFTDENHALHRDHCIDQIRQYVMCTGDLTPLPTRYTSAYNRYYVDSDYSPHTCRNFDALHGWILDRHNGSSAVEPRFGEREGPQSGKQ